MEKIKKTSDAKKGGLFVGKSHDEGGIPAIVVDTGQPIEVEGGEAIINKKATAKHWKELSKINESTGGVPIPPPDRADELLEKFEKGGKLTQLEKKTIHNKWKNLVNMTYTQLKKYYDSKDGKSSGLTQKEADDLGIDSGRESAVWIMKMKRTNYKDWTPEMWRWAKKQISFISRMRGNKGELMDNGKRTPKLKSLLIWGHNPYKYEGGGDIPKESKHPVDANSLQVMLKYASKEDAPAIQEQIAKLKQVHKEKYKKKSVKYAGGGKPSDIASAILGLKALLKYPELLEKYDRENIEYTIKGLEILDKMHPSEIDPNDTSTGVKFIKYKDSEIMYEPIDKKYYANDEEFNSLEDAKAFLDSGKVSDSIRGAMAYEASDDDNSSVNLLAPNGKPSNLTPEQYKLVRTPEFKAWFGDWENDPKNSSKVIDENGEPLVVYRGDSSASKKGNIFKKGFNRMGFINKNRLPNQYFYYFVNSKDVALEYAKNQIEDHNNNVKYAGKGKMWEPKVTSYFLNIKDPLDITPNNPFFPTFQEYENSIKKELGQKWYKEEEYRTPYDYGNYISTSSLNKIYQQKFGKNYLDIDEYYDLPKHQKESFENDWRTQLVWSYFVEYKDSDFTSNILHRLYQNMKKSKVDGLIFLEKTHWNDDFIDNIDDYRSGKKKYDYKNWVKIPKVFAALESNQIKLADGTNTTFDSSNPDIRFEEGGSLTEQILSAPNGKPSNLTPEQYRLVRTPEFKAWFGDWENNPLNASKVVDENGEPLVLYSGSPYKFNEFKSDEILVDINDREYKPRFWFTIDKEYADSMSKKGVGTPTIYVCFLNVRNPKYDDLNLFVDEVYDGSIYHNRNKINVVTAIESNQIKLADGTNTTFDSNNPDIRFKDGGSAPEKSGIFLNGKELTLGEAIEITKEDITQLEEQERSLRIDKELNKRYQDLKKLELKEQISSIRNKQDKTRNISEYNNLEKKLQKLLKQLREKYSDGGSVSNQTLLAPNGKPSNLTPEQYKLVRTPEFKNWFGDWENSPETASKVVDENGEPLVVYHFSDIDFNVFELKGRSAGFFFVANKYDDEFSSEGVIKSLDQGIIPRWLQRYNISEKEIRERLKESKYKVSKPYFLSIKRLNKSVVSDFHWSTPSFENPIIRQSKYDSYDGIEFINEIDQKRIIVAFEPEQIKLADGSNTTFDSENPDIRFKTGGSVEKLDHRSENFGKPKNFDRSIFIHETNEIDAQSILKNGFTPNTNEVITNGVYTIPKQWKENSINNGGVDLEIILKPNAKIFWTDSDRPMDFVMGYGNKFFENLYETLNKGHISPRIANTSDNREDWWKEKTRFSRSIEQWLKENGYAGIQQGGEIVITDLSQIDIVKRQNKFESGGSIESSILLAPNGKPSNLTPEQYKLVRTPEFKAWFGDWENLYLTKVNDSGIDEVSLKKIQDSVSKVVDENGEPIVVYHGTFAKEIKVFDESQIGYNSGNEGHYGFGFYFSYDIKEAKTYTSNESPNILHCFLNIKNPFYANKLNHLELYSKDFGYPENKEPVAIDSDWMENSLKNFNVNAYNLYKSIKNSGFDTELGWKLFLNKYPDAINDSFDLNLVTDWIEYDGLQERFSKNNEPENFNSAIPDYILESISDVLNIPISEIKTINQYTIGNYPNLLYMMDLGNNSRYLTDRIKKDGFDGIIAGSELVVFKSNQIKLADGSNTTFDINNQDIRFKRGGVSEGLTYKKKYNKKYGYDLNESHSLEEISKDTGVSIKGLQEIYNKGVGAYRTNPESVRPNVKSPEQWAMARVYSAVMGGKTARIDAKELKMEKGGKLDEKDKVTIDVPLLIRILELSREDIKSDAELHQMVERILDLKNKGTLTMDDYDFISKLEQKVRAKYSYGGSVENNMIVIESPIEMLDEINFNAQFKN